MEFKEKLQELRRERGLTQEALAEQLFVSRTAVSKWESGRGLPDIASLCAIARFFSVTVDELLSAEGVLSVAREEQTRTKGRFRDLVFGLADVGMALFLFLPLFAERGGEGAQSLSLLAVGGNPFFRVLGLLVVACSVCMGITSLALQTVSLRFWEKHKRAFSLGQGILAVLLFTVGLHPYAAVLAFCLLLLKAAVLVKR